MFCGDCGTSNADHHRFCATCGSRLADRSPSALGHAVPQVVPTPHAYPTPPVVPAPAAPAPRRPRRRRGLLVAVPLVVALVLGLVGGRLAGFLPTGTASSTFAAGRLQPLTAGGPVVEDDATGTPTTNAAGEGDGTPIDPTTAFVTSCGAVLDIVPTAAVEAGTAVRVTLEFRPVCPDGEWISSSSMRLDVLDADTGSSLAVGDFDFSSEHLFVPGFDDPLTVLEADFGPGTAWAAPETLASRISDGAVLVDCVATDGSIGEIADPGSGSEPSTGPSTARTTPRDAGSLGDSVAETALEALERQADADEPSVRALEGAWIPQLSSKKDGTYDDLDGRTYRLADIYQQYLDLRLRYPDVRLLRSGDWGSYTLSGYWVVIAAIPYLRPGEPNRWCNRRGIAPSQCFAKRLVRDGAPDGTTRHRG